MSSGNDVQRACPLCGQDCAEIFLQKDVLRLVRCRACSMVYADPITEEAASNQFYERRAFYLSADKLESDYAPVRFERELRIFRAWCSAGAVLDVGCSTGAFLHELKKRYAQAYSVLGIDIVGPALDYAEIRGVRVTRGPFLEVKTHEQGFEAITFWAVLE